MTPPRKAVYGRRQGLDRRTVLRRAAVLGGVPASGGLAGCFGDLSDGDPAGGDDGGGAVADTSDLRTGTTIGVVFTAFGGQTSRSDVDPDEPGGGRLVRVEALEPGEQVTITWRETVEQEVTPTDTPNAGVGTPTPTPSVEIVERSGTVTATGLAVAHEPFLPMFWEPEETTTETSAMWLSREAYQELSETRRTSWSRDVLTRISWVGKEVQERIHSGVEEVDEVYLEAEPDGIDFELTVDGQRTTVQAIEAHDSFGNKRRLSPTMRCPWVLLDLTRRCGH